MRSLATRNLLCLSTILVLALLSASVPGIALGAEPREITIENIRFEGLDTLTRDELLRKVQSRPGTAYDAEVVRGDLKRLAPLAWDWPSVRMAETDTGVELVFVLKENPTLGGVEFIGNSKVETKQLEKLIRIRPGDVVTRDAVGKAQEAVRHEYQALGYHRTQVQATLTPGDGDQGSVLQVLVNEGRKLQVDDLVIEGNENFSAARLKLHLQTKGSVLFVKNYFDDVAFEEDLKALAAFYHRAGYFDATAQRGAFHFDETKKTITPTIIVTEGARYRFGKASARGNTLFTREEIEEAFSSLQGKFFNARDYGNALKKVHALYTNSGFVTTEIEDVMSFDADQGVVNATIQVDESARTRIGRILVERKRDPLSDDDTWLEDASWFAKTYHRVAPPVDNDVILQEISLKPGDVYDKRKEAESIARLRELGIFENVGIESRATDKAGVRDVLIRAEEGVTGNILIGVGFSEALGAYVWGNYTERNLLGQADSLRLNVLAGSRSINAGVSYFNRHLRGGDKSLLTELRRLHARRPGFDEINTGVLAEIGIPHDNPEWKTFVRARIEYVQVDEDGNNPKEDFNVDYPVAALRWKLVHDTRIYEDFRGVRSMVTDGHLSSVAFEGGFADGALAKLTARYNWFHKIGEKTILSSDWRVGLMPVNADDIGPTERFYMGGSKDLRGFRLHQAGTHDSRDSDVPLGGATKILTRNELRYPLADNITGLWFLDAGMLGHDAFDFDTPRAATGLGFRLDIKGIRAGIDLALPFSASSDDQKKYFHLSLSTQRGF